MIDALTTFDFEGRAARGAFVDLRTGLDTMLGHRSYAADVRRLLGEALAASPLLASHLKFEGRINLQFQGSGPVTLLVTQIDHELKLRGMAKAGTAAAGDFAGLLGGGTLALMLEPLGGRQNYQALVPIESHSLAAALEGYYAQSEQLPTRLCLAAGQGRLRGLMLQWMPARHTVPRQVGAGASRTGSTPPSHANLPASPTPLRSGAVSRLGTGAHCDTVAANAYWSYLGVLFDTLSAEELLATDGETLLRRLFHAEPLRVFAPRPVRLACACSHASISGMLLALGKAELDLLLAERGKVEVTCEFCGKPSVYTALEVNELFAAHAASASEHLRH